MKPMNEIERFYMALFDYECDCSAKQMNGRTFPIIYDRSLDNIIRKIQFDLSRGGLTVEQHNQLILMFSEMRISD